jgi:hypothetical protein
MKFEEDDVGSEFFISITPCEPDAAATPISQMSAMQIIYSSSSSSSSASTVVWAIPMICK